MKRFDIRNAITKVSIAENLNAEQVEQLIISHAGSYNSGRYVAWETPRNTMVYSLGFAFYEVMPL
jgi:hypothetical protein